MNDKDIEKIYKDQLAKDFHFNPELLDMDKISILEPELFDSNARVCFYGKPFLEYIYSGEGIVCIADSSISLFAEEYARKAHEEKFRVFDAPNIGALERELNKHKYTIAHIAVYSVPKANCYREESMNSIRIYRGNQIEELYSYPEFTMALSYDDKYKKDMIAVAYIQNGKPVGIAACSNDAEKMWQIGVDVHKEYRNKGVATRLINILTRLILEAGKIPYYCCAYSNIPSLNLSRKCGYKTAWIEITAKPLEEEWIKEIVG